MQRTHEALIAVGRLFIVVLLLIVLGYFRLPSVNGACMKACASKLNFVGGKIKKKSTQDASALRQ